MPSVWKGSITFGLVNVPVELRPAVRSSHLSFRMLHEKDNTPVRFQRVREDDGSVIPWQEIVKGYEIEKGEFVVLDKKDFEKAAIEQSHTLDILDFVEVGSVDPRFYDSAYFVVPAKAGERAFALLRDALAETNMSGVGKIIVHRRQHIAEIRADGNALVLMMMRFAEELVSADEYTFPPHSKKDAKELRMAVDLVRSLEGPFDASKYTDEYDENLRQIIEAKAKGRRVKLSGPDKAGREPKVIDLMERLQASLRQSKRKTTAAGRKKRPAHPPARATRKTRARTA